jgi:surfeit locus 1 family protein
VKKFKPSFSSTFIVILMMAVLLSLGTWQLSRSKEKQQLIDSYKRAPSLPAIHPSDLKAGWDSFQFRKLELNGRYANDYQILLENQIREGKLGYMVLTPFEPEGRESVILVNRGWIEKASLGSNQTEIAVSDGYRHMSGLVSHPPGVGIKMGSLDDSAPGWPKIVPYIEISWLALQMGKKVEPWIVLLSEDQSDGFIRDWQPSVRITPSKHVGYAFQWYSLALALLILFIVISVKSESNNEPDDGGNEVSK